MVSGDKLDTVSDFCNFLIEIWKNTPKLQVTDVVMAVVLLYMYYIYYNFIHKYHYCYLIIKKVFSENERMTDTTKNWFDARLNAWSTEVSDISTTTGILISRQPIVPDTLRDWHHSSGSEPSTADSKNIFATAKPQLPVHLLEFFCTQDPSTCFCFTFRLNVVSCVTDTFHVVAVTSCRPQLALLTRLCLFINPLWA